MSDPIQEAASTLAVFGCIIAIVVVALLLAVLVVGAVLIRNLS